MYIVYAELRKKCGASWIKCYILQSEYMLWCTIFTRIIYVVCVEVGGWTNNMWPSLDLCNFSQSEQHKNIWLKPDWVQYAQYVQGTTTPYLWVLGSVHFVDESFSS